MIPDKPGQRPHFVPRKGGHSTDTVLWIQQAVPWKPAKYEKRRLFPGSTNRGHWVERNQLTGKIHSVLSDL